MSNFTFLQPEWDEISRTAQKAEGYLRSDPRSACFYARRTLEQAVNWLYDHDPDFSPPYDNKLITLMTDYSFLKNVPAQIGSKGHIIRKLGNKAVHGKGKLSEQEAFTAVRELYHLLYWLARTYTERDSSQFPAQFDEKEIPPAPSQIRAQTASALQKLDEELNAKDEALRAQKKTLAEYQSQINALQAKITRVKSANQKIQDTHDYNEAETREYLIDILLREAGWNPKGENVEEYPVVGMPNKPGRGFVDYVLWGDDGRALGLVEAKRTSVEPEKGKQQAKLYADCLEKMHGQRPIIFYSNGYQTWLWDDKNYPPRQVQGFYTKSELELLIQRRKTRQLLKDIPTNKAIANRDYQEEAIRRVAEHFESKYRKALLVMATGTGKTRVAIALTDLLMRANWAKRILFLADRTALVRQAVTSFKKYLPEANPVNLLDEKDAQESRIVVSTYHTMMGLIGESAAGEEKRFGVGHFDLIIIDEAHRSVYHKFGAIFDYFDSLLIGLTATPKDEVDRNTYHLFELEDGVPTFNYDLEVAVADRYLVPPRALSVPTKFQREGIKYDDLSDAEKLEWDLIEWNEEGEIPDKIDPAALNNWLFNQNTVDQVLQFLMERGLKVQGGDRLGKTIIFAKNHKHAEYIQKRFDANYPHLAGQFARVIDNYQTYAQSLIDDFSDPDKNPHIAISVDMLDTGIDIPELLNLVFFKMVRSKTKFFQMLGRGTRLCPDLFAPGVDKEEFYVFDYCENFEFFNQNPKGVETAPAESLSASIFKRRLALLEKYAHLKLRDPEVAELESALLDELHQRVSAMPPENFIVRPHREFVDKFSERSAWEKLSQGDYADLSLHLADLPTQLPEEHETAKRFDLLILQMELSLLEGTKRFERLREKVMMLAHQLETKITIPQVKRELELILEIQDENYWTGITLKMLEEIRLRLRGLIRFVDKNERDPIYTNFKDQFGEVREVQANFVAGGVNIAQYKKKVEEFVRQHQNEQVIRKIRFAMPLSAEDLAQLETFFFDADETGTREEFESAYGADASLSLFIRRLTGLDRRAAKELFAEYLDDKTFTADQIRFVNYIIEHLTANGTIPEEILYQQPYTNIHEMGLDGVFPKLAGRIIELVRKVNQVANGIGIR